MPPRPAIQLLVVEDSPEDREFYRRLLCQPGGRAYDIHEAESIQQGCDCLTTLEPDGILLDYHLPDGNAFDLLDHIADRAEGRIATVMLTGQGSEQTAAQALRRGVFDYLIKAELTAESLDASIHGAISRLRQRRRQTQQRRQLHDALESERSRSGMLENELSEIRSELRVARNIQQRLLPKDNPTIAGWDIASYSRPAEELGGDIFGYFREETSHPVAVVGDASGHGVSAALTMVDFRAYLHAALTQFECVGEAVNRLSELVLSDRLIGRFMTLSLMELSTERHELLWVSAGHPGYILATTGTMRLMLQTANPPLGVAPINGHLSTQHHIRPGEILVVPTDGLYEQRCEDGAEYGIHRLLETVHKHRDLPAEAVCQQVFADLDHATPHPPADDQTILIARAVSRDSAP